MELHAVAEEPLPAISDFMLGQEFDGEVAAISDHGAVVRLDGTQTTGFLHVSEISETQKYVAHPAEEVSVGQKVRVRVLKADPAFLGLTRKNLGKKSVNDFMIGQEVRGTVKTVKAAGAWIDIGADREGFLHKSQIKESGFVDDARTLIEAGEEVTVRIRNKDEAKGNIEVTMKPAKEVLNPLQRGLKVEDLKEGEETGGVVKSVKDFGCFVDVGAEADGLLHQRHINDGVVYDMQSLLKHGDKVTVKVRGMFKGRLDLELTSTLTRLPDVDAFTSVPRSLMMDATVAKMERFGMFLDIAPPRGDGPKVLGFMRYKQAIDVVDIQEGDRIKVRIAKVVKQNRQLFLTMRPLEDKTDKPPGGSSGAGARQQRY